MAILDNGMISVDGEPAVEISEYINKTIDDVIVNRLDAFDIESATRKSHYPSELIVIAELAREMDAHCVTTPYWKMDKSFKINEDNEPYVPTIIIPIRHKEAEESFNYMKDNTLGEILRTTTLAKTYVSIKDTWLRLNENPESGTNIFYAKNVIRFLDDDGNMLEETSKINVLVMAFPDKKSIQKWARNKLIDNPSRNEIPEEPQLIMESIIDEVVKGAIVTDTAVMCINPFFVTSIVSTNHVNQYDIVTYWIERLGSEDAKSHMDATIFAVGADATLRFNILNKIIASNTTPHTIIA